MILILLTTAIGTGPVLHAPRPSEPEVAASVQRPAPLTRVCVTRFAPSRRTPKAPGRAEPPAALPVTGPSAAPRPAPSALYAPPALAPLSPGADPNSPRDPPLSSPA